MYKFQLFILSLLTCYHKGLACQPFFHQNVNYMGGRHLIFPFRCHYLVRIFLFFIQLIMLSPQEPADQANVLTEFLQKK